MDWFRTQLESALPNTVLHLGSGVCPELAMMLRAGATRVCLVEANPALCLKLRRHVANCGLRNVETISAAVSDYQGDGNLKMLNVKHRSSLRSYTEALILLYPGLRMTGQISVPVIDAASLVRGLSLPSIGINLLILDAPGEERSVLNSLAKDRQLHKFKHIVIRAGLRELYEDSGSSEELLEWISSQGYELVDAIDRQDLGLPRMHLRLKSPSGLLEDIARLRQDIERKSSLSEEINRLRQDLEKQSNLLTLREGDLEDLQKRYGMQRDLLIRYRNLLGEVWARLEIAKRVDDSLGPENESEKLKDLRDKITTILDGGD